MKYYFAVLLSALCLTAPTWGEDLLLTKIEVLVTGSTSDQVVRGAFLEISEGQTYPREQLEDAVRMAEDRLNTREYFSTVTVTLVVSRKVPGTARIVAEVTDGFQGRFGGGNAWASVGGVDVGGEGKDWTLALGWNRQDFTWTDGNPGWTGGSWQVTAGNAPWDWVDQAGTAQEDHLAGSMAQVTQAWGWGWSTTGFQNTWWDFDPGYTTGQFRTDQGLAVTWNRAAPGFSPDRGAWVQGRISGFFPGGLYREEADARAYLSLGAGLKAAFRVAGATQQGSYGPKDAQDLTGIDGLRQPFSPDDLVRSQVWASAELRWAVLRVPFLGFTNLAVEPALVADFGKGWDAGAALRLYWAVPVDVPLRIEWTIDNQSRTWFGFAVENPF